MEGQQLVFTVLLLLFIAFIPPLFYIRLIKKVSNRTKVGWGTLLKVFLSGAVVAVILGLAISFIFFYSVSLGTEGFGTNTLKRAYDMTLDNSALSILFLVVIVAPVAEELGKGICVNFWKGRMKYEVDGLLLGTTVGFGFAATENLLYEGAAFFSEENFMFFVTLAVLRSISSMLLHGSATGIFGLGLARARIKQSSLTLFPYYLTAVGMHAIFNSIAAGLPILGAWAFGDESTAYYGTMIASLVLVIVFAGYCFLKVWRKTIREGRKVKQAQQQPPGQLQAMPRKGQQQRAPDAKKD